VVNIKPISSMDKLSDHAGYRKDLDGLRGVAVIFVVLFHAFPDFLRGGFTGVDIFFVISGYIITRKYYVNIWRENFNVKLYIFGRVRRLFPSLLLVMISSLLFGWFCLTADEYKQLANHILRGTTSTLNFALVEESGYFDNSADSKPMQHLWSLAVEVQFYLTLPMFLWGMFKLKLKGSIGLALLMVFSLSLNLYFVRSHENEVFFLLPARMWEFMCGSIVAAFAINYDNYERKLKNNNGIIIKIRKASSVILYHFCANKDLISIFGFVLLLMGAIFINKQLAYPSLWAFIPVGGTLILIISGPTAWINRVIISNRVLLWFGLISYSLYLWHWPALSFLRIITAGKPDMVFVVLSVFVSLFFAHFTTRFIEVPIRYGYHWERKTILLLVLMFITGISSLYIDKTNGVTAYNRSLKYISDARGDWAFPSGLIFNNNLYTTSEKRPTVLMIGDSHVQAFGPRVVDMYKKDKIKEVGFLTGCAPIPILVGCEKYFDAIEHALTSHAFDTVILGGSLEKIFESKGAGYLVNHNDREIPIDTVAGRAYAKQAFLEFIRSLMVSHDVVLLSHAPSSRFFDPSNILAQAKGYRSVPLSQSVENMPFYIDNKFERELRSWVEPLKIPLISQVEVICPDKICFPLLSDGRPKFKDQSHLRPYFVTEYIDILDDYLMKN
jgi:peptidoglycan/LPS O-acetylase OafA/YrhL